MNHLAERNPAFCGDSDRLFESGNGNFFGQVELISQFESCQRIKANELSDTYLSKHIQN